MPAKWKQLSERDRNRYAMAVVCPTCGATNGATCRKRKPGDEHGYNGAAVPPHARRCEQGYKRAYSAAGSAAATTTSSIDYVLSLWEPGDGANVLTEKVKDNPQPKVKPPTASQVQRMREEVANDLRRRIAEGE